jgi:hypothetical protein
VDRLKLHIVVRLLQRPSKKQSTHMAYVKLCLVLLLTCGIIGNAYADTDKESAVKIGILYNFFKFIDWPQSADTSAGYRLCTTDDNSLGDSLLTLQGKTINNKVLNIKRGVSDKELKNCHMVFIGTEENASKSIKDLQGLAVVTVSDKPDFIDQGGIIGLVQEDNHLSFEVNLDAARAVDIGISAQILKLAKRVNVEK